MHRLGTVVLIVGLALTWFLFVDTSPALIEAGGPYPYSRDGVVFENRELYDTDDHYASFVLVRDGSGGDTS